MRAKIAQPRTLPYPTPSDSERVALFTSRCLAEGVFELDVDSAMRKPDSIEAWKRQHYVYVRKRTVEALAKLGIEGDPSAWRAVQRDYGRVILHEMGGHGEPRKLPPDAELLAEHRRLGRGADGKLARKFHVTQDAVRKSVKRAKKTTTK